MLKQQIEFIGKIASQKQDLNSDVLSLKKELTEVTADRNVKLRELEDMTRRNSDLATQFQKSEKLANDLGSENRQLKRRLEELENELHELKGTNVEVNGAVRYFEQKEKGLKTQIKLAHKKIEQLEETLMVKEGQHKLEKHQIAEYTQQLVDDLKFEAQSSAQAMERQQSVYTQIIKALELGLQDAQLEVEMLQNENTKLKDANITLKNWMHHPSNKLNKLRQSPDYHRDENDDYESDDDTHQQAERPLQQVIAATVKRELTKAEQQHKQLTEHLKSYSPSTDNITDLYSVVHKRT